MPQPFSVRSQKNPGVDLGDWDAQGNITIPGTLTAGNVVGGGGSSGVESVTAGDSSITVVNTDPANPTVAVSSALQATITGKAPSASPTFTGTATVSDALVLTVSAFTSVSGTVTPDCSTANNFRYSLTGNTTVAAPTNASDGQKIVLEFVQDATGSRTVNTSALHFGTTITSFTATTTASKRDKIGVIYNATAGVFDVVAVAQGF